MDAQFDSIKNNNSGYYLKKNCSDENILTRCDDNLENSENLQYNIKCDNLNFISFDDCEESGDSDSCNSFSDLDSCDLDSSDLDSCDLDSCDLDSCDSNNLNKCNNLENSNICLEKLSDNVCNISNISLGFEKDIEWMQNQINSISGKLATFGKKMANCEEPFYENFDILQLQLNNLNKKFLDMIKKDEGYKLQYKQVLSEIDNIYMMLDSGHDQVVKLSTEANKVCKNRLVYTDYTQVHHYKIDMDIDMIFITIIAGGGAGGLGFTKGFYYYSGGGGGAGAIFIKKPVEVKFGSILIIKVGKGGSLYEGRDGEDSYVEIIHPSGEKEKILVHGGSNGHPNINFDETVDGGLGGKNDYNPSFQGKVGDSGKVSIPSQFAAQGGDGANSHFFKGGQGGGNYFNIGGLGGDSVKIVGTDGKFGSGGGGSAPKSNIKLGHKLSGDGGNGLVIIEWC